MPEIGTFGTRQISGFRARGLPSQFRSALDTILTQAGPLPATFAGVDARLRRRLRAIVWKQWKRGSARFVELRRRASARDLTAQTAGSPHVPWRLANSRALSIALPNSFFGSLGLTSVAAPRPA
jgi:hypothetical protein